MDLDILHRPGKTRDASASKTIIRPNDKIEPAMQTSHNSPHTRAVLQALLVTFLWSTSWVIIKFGLKDLPPLTFAGLRYTLAFLCLLPFALRKLRKESLKPLAPADWGRLVLLGIFFYSVTQGAQVFGLAALPAVTVSVLLNFTSPLVAFLGILILSERPSRLQWAGVALFLVGMLTYFYPVIFPANQVLGLVVVLAGVLANSLAGILGRSINRSRVFSPLLVTVISMGIGAPILLVAGILLQGWVELSLASILMIAWLAVVNTAFAFTLWNRTLQDLSAIESTIINGTMLVQIAILAVLFLDETLSIRQVSGMVLVGVGAVLVQLVGRSTRVNSKAR
jgi:drug/metabolite transporter (DMT)-like permease